MQPVENPSRQARQLEKEGRFGEAAALWERQGDLERAIGLYVKAGLVDRAADIMRINGRGMAAAELYEKVGQYRKAAAIYEVIFEFAQAGAALVKAGELERAAAMYEQADAFAEAAALYCELGNLRRAAQLFERAGDAERAAELRARAAATGHVAEEEPLELGEGEVLDVRRVVEAVVSHLRAGRSAEAARLYGSCQENIGYPVLTAIAGDAEAERQAAQMFVAANDFPMAAQLFDNLGDFVAAAQMYERAEDPYVAAEMYLRAGDQARAAVMYERSGHYRQAAEQYLAVRSPEKAALCYERADDHFLAGRLYAAMKKPQRALQLLQKVQPGDAEYLEASRLVGEALAVGGHLDLAIRKLVEAVRGVELGERSAAVYITLARVLERAGHLAEALAVYQRLAAWQPDYGDAAEKVRALQGAAAQAPARPASPLPPPVPSGAAAEGPAPARPAAPGLVSMMDGFEFLKDTPLFRDLSLAEMKVVYNACETRRFAPGEVMIEQDQPGEALYVLRKGTARVLRADGGQQEQVARLGPGSPAGEMALVDDAPTSARVIAETEVEAFCITRELFDGLLASSDAIAVKIYRFFVFMLVRRLRATNLHLAKARS